MLQEDETTEPVDGRVARRERNIAAVLDVVIEMYGEDMFMPTIEQASKRSGLSLRSLYRYFTDPGELHEAAIKNHRKMTNELARLPNIGQGVLAQRIDDFVAMRMRLYEAAAPVFRATVHCAGTNDKIRENLAEVRRDLQQQFELQFAPELKARSGRKRSELLAAGNVLTQLDSIDLLRTAQGLSVSQTHATLVSALTALFAS